MSSDPERQQRQQQWRRPRMGSALLLCPVLVALAVRRYENVACVVNRTLSYRVFLSANVQNWLRRTEDRGGTTARSSGRYQYLIPVRELCLLASGFAPEPSPLEQHYRSGQPFLP